jgi:hypothetical protein
MFKLFSRIGKSGPTGTKLDATVPKPRELLTDSEWVRLRAPKRDRDQVLSDKATRWRSKLPPEVRPDALCSQFPRIANRFAHCWRDHGLTDYLFDDLLIDRRGSRQGFPPAVDAELRSLRTFHEARSTHAVVDPVEAAGSPKTRVWDAR